MANEGNAVFLKDAIITNVDFSVHFAFRIDAWTDDGENIVEHLAGVEDRCRGAVMIHET